ncbi:C2 family cysteine protease [Pantanalinema rosaneae CENA516]|uniref:C2 family cysteine protease n=1 Tax=Pantanalinema rosaneae TaxID=1620701 RepID=UPI003D6EC8FB
MPTDLAGNSLVTARNVTLSSSIQTFTDYVGSLDTNDYYRFSLSGRSSFNLTLSGLSADADVALLNGTGAVIASSVNGGTTVDSIARTLDAGTYYIRVYPYSGSTNYNLGVSAAPVLPPDYAGNALSSARSISVGSTTSTYSDWVGTGDTNDYYRFSLSGRSNFNLLLNGLSADADVQLLNSVGTLIASSVNGGTSADSIARTLDAGTYYIRVYQFSGNTNYNLGLSATAVVSPITDWYSQNLRDAQLVSLTRSLAADGNLSRNDMLAIFSNIQDGSIIDSNEVLDLRTIVSNSSRFTMLDPVRWLSDQVANGASTNMSASQFDSTLVGRWFRGTYTPTAQFARREDNGSTTIFNLNFVSVQGSLYGSSGRAQIGDIDQGQLGDCTFLAALGATFGRQSNDAGNAISNVINNMITNNGDGTYTIRFFSSGGAQYQTVDQRLAYYNGTQLLGARTNGNVLWAALAERAYAQWQEWRSGRPGYNEIGNGDYIINLLPIVTGRTANYTSTTQLSFSQLQTAFNNNQAVAASSLTVNTQDIVRSHAYSVTNVYVNSSGQQRVVVRNPWGVDGRAANGDAYDGFIDLSFESFRSQFSGIAIA